MKEQGLSFGLLATLLLVCLAVLLITFPVLAAVTLVRFEITSITNSAITLEWETASEYNILGFFIVRSASEEGVFTPVSNFIIAEGSAVNGSIYQFKDESIQSGQNYYYKLEVVDLSSNSEFYGPISNTLNATATSTGTISSSTAIRSDTNTTTPTKSTTPTRTLTARIAITPTITPSLTETSPFSFVTNTHTLIPTHTLTDTITDEATRVYTDTETSQPTRIEVKTATAATSQLPSPSIVATVDQVGPAIRSVSVGFGVVLGGGLLGLAVLILISRTRNVSDV